MKAVDDYYLQQPEPIQGCLLALREIILSQDREITNELKYGMPFFCYKGKMFCYLWVHKKLKQPYLGIVEGRRIEHRDLIVGDRARMKIMLFDTAEDLPIKTINSILRQVLKLYQTGVIK